MELCVNYTSEVRELFEEGEIDFIDYLKLYSINGDLAPFDWCAERRRVVFHGLIGKGSNAARKDFLEDRDFKLQAKYFENSRVPHISFHISLGKTEEFETSEKTIKTIVDNVNGIRKYFSYDILLENSPLSVEKKEYHFLANPDFITQVINTANTYFLLDIAHARAAAYVLGYSYMDYINRLPLDKVKEIHLSGCVKNSSGEIIPNHSKLNDEDYEVLEYLMEKCDGLKVLTLEYGPYDIYTKKMIATYEKVDSQMKKEVYNDLIKLKEILNK